MKSSNRRYALFLVLAATVAASVWPDSRQPGAEDVVAPADKADAPGRTLPEIETLALERLERREVEPMSGIDPFRAKGWYVPPPAPAALPPPKPTAPPLPFTYMGRAEEVGGENAMIYLSSGDNFYPVSVGEVFAGNYSLDAIEGETLVFTYRPLSVQQRLFVGHNE